ncbi:MAG: L,D-transpeptidase family protein [Flavobacteriales bacterium]|nr:L,D-transpeptidase family protein [Flavobacteriales bacterium]
MDRPVHDVDTAAVAGSRVTLQRLCDSLAIPKDSVHFLVHKDQRRFVVKGLGRELKTYPCVLGERPVGDKFHQGDRRTPEGVFGFRGKRVHAQWHKFVWIDYPNAESWRRYHERKATGAIPAGKDIGGEIGIHGVPAGMDHWIESGVDWTWGCIALRNADMDEIYPFIRLGTTTITIMP